MMNTWLDELQQNRILEHRYLEEILLEEEKRAQMIGLQKEALKNIISHIDGFFARYNGAFVFREKLISVPQEIEPASCKQGLSKLLVQETPFTSNILFLSPPVISFTALEGAKDAKPFAFPPRRYFGASRICFSAKSNGEPVFQLAVRQYSMNRMDGKKYKFVYRNTAQFYFETPYIDIQAGIDAQNQLTFKIGYGFVKCGPMSVKAVDGKAAAFESAVRRLHHANTAQHDFIERYQQLKEVSLLYNSHSDAWWKSWFPEEKKVSGFFKKQENHLMGILPRFKNYQEMRSHTDQKFAPTLCGHNLTDADLLCMLEFLVLKDEQAMQRMQLPPVLSPKSQTQNKPSFWKQWLFQ